MGRDSFVGVFGVYGDGGWDGGLAFAGLRG